MRKTFPPAGTQRLNRSQEHGFTLLELLIVIAIMGILLTIAVPQYSDHVRRSKITDGTGQLAQYRVQLEQYFQDNRTYGAANGACALAGQNAQAFNIACTVGATTDSFTATGTSVGGFGLGANGDYVYSINQGGTKGTTKFAGTTHAAGTKTCWLVRGTEC